VICKRKGWIFETYAPAVCWSTIRSIHLLVLQEDRNTGQVDYNNAFTQTKSFKTVFVEPSKIFGPISGKVLVLKLRKRSFGLKQAPRTLVENLRLDCWNLDLNNLILSIHEKWNYLCCLCWWYSFWRSQGEELDKETASLGVQLNKVMHSFQLRNEGEVGNFLGSRIDKMSSNDFPLT